MTRRWVLACAIAETVGMAAAAGAARAAESLSATAGLLLVVTGGLVEGTALGVLQARVLSRRLGSHRVWWTVVTLLVAGLGWAAGSAPAALSGDSDGSTPPLGLVLAGAAAMGAAMGALLGLAQAEVLRRAGSRHPWRWVTANAAGWALAMPVVFAGATTAGSSWSWPALVCWGAGTGAVAGTVLGAVSGAWLESLDGLHLRHRLVLGWLVRRRSEARAGWTGLAVTGRRTGRVVRFPVMTAPLAERSLVVLPGHPDRKSWWRQVRPGCAVGVLDRRVWRVGGARLVDRWSPEWSAARAAYAVRWPRAVVGAGPLVVVELDAAELSSRQDEGPAEVGPGAVGAQRTVS